MKTQFQVTVTSPTNASTSYIGYSKEKAFVAYFACQAELSGLPAVPYRTIYLTEGNFVIARTSWDRDGVISMDL